MFYPITPLREPEIGRPQRSKAHRRDDHSPDGRDGRERRGAKDLPVHLEVRPQLPRGQRLRAEHQSRGPPPRKVRRLPSAAQAGEGEDRALTQGLDHPILT